jgi:hypothetical protein
VTGNGLLSAAWAKTPRPFVVLRLWSLDKTSNLGNAFQSVGLCGTIREGEMNREIMRGKEGKLES